MPDNKVDNKNDNKEDDIPEVVEQLGVARLVSPVRTFLFPEARATHTLANKCYITITKNVTNHCLLTVGSMTSPLRRISQTTTPPPKKFYPLSVVPNDADGECERASPDVSQY